MLVGICLGTDLFIGALALSAIAIGLWIAYDYVCPKGK